MSNTFYFNKNPGSLFGISGTLGGLGELELLTRTYNVTSFGLPRFKLNKCIEKMPQL